MSCTPSPGFRRKVKSSVSKARDRLWIIRFIRLTCKHHMFPHAIMHTIHTCWVKHAWTYTPSERLSAIKRFGDVEMSSARWGRVETGIDSVESHAASGMSKGAHLRALYSPLRRRHRRRKAEDNLLWKRPLWPQCKIMWSKFKLTIWDALMKAYTF